LSVVWNLRLFVHGATHAMPAVVLDNRIAEGLNIRLDRVAHIPETVSNHALSDGLVERLPRGLHKPLDIVGYVPDSHGYRRVAHVAQVRGPAVDAHYVALAKLALTGD